MKTWLCSWLIVITILRVIAVEPPAPPVLEAQMYAGVTITGTVGRSYAIQATMNPADANAWVTITNVVLPASPWVFIDYDSPALGKRFYRAVEADTNVVPLDLEFEEPPIDLRLIDARFARGVAYGPYEDNVFDIFLVESAEPTPLVVFIHGGGFTSGGRGIVYITARDEIRETLARGASYATIDYRLLDEVDKEGVLKPLGDSRRCLQFLRCHHEELNVDPTRVALYGASAGAGTSLWLGVTDDMADPGALDPVLRESTRVSVVGLKGTQATYDLLKWETVVFASLGLTLEDFAALPNSSEQGLLSFYGADTLEDLGSPEFKAYRERVDMLALLSLDDPPIWLQSTVENPGIPVDKSELMHHGLHALAVLERANEVGVECQAYIPALDVAAPAGDDVVKFMLDRLRGE